MFNRLVIFAIVFFIGLQGSMATAQSGLDALTGTAEPVALAREFEPVATLRDPDPSGFASRWGGPNGSQLHAGVRPRLLAELDDVSFPPVPRSIPPNLFPRASQPGLKLQV